MPRYKITLHIRKLWWFKHFYFKTTSVAHKLQAKCQGTNSQSQILLSISWHTTSEGYPQKAEGMLWLFETFSTSQSHVGVQGSTISPKRGTKKENWSGPRSGSWSCTQLYTLQIAERCSGSIEFNRKMLTGFNKDRFNTRTWNTSTSQLKFQYKMSKCMFYQATFMFCWPLYLVSTKNS